MRSIQYGKFQSDRMSYMAAAWALEQAENQETQIER